MFSRGWLDWKALMRSEMLLPMGRRGVVNLDEEGVGEEPSGRFSMMLASVLARWVHARILGASSR